MGKLTAYILGVFGALLVSYYLLSTYYIPLIHWLGPFLGTPIMFLLPILFLLLGNPLTYPIVIVAWLIIAFMVALGARKGGRALGMSITVYLSILVFLALSVMALVSGTSLLSGTSLSSTSIGSLTGVFSHPPAGTNLYTLEKEPLVGELVTLFSSSFNIFGSGAVTPGSLSTSQLLTSIENTFLIYLGINFVIFLVASYIFGRIIHGFVHPKKNMREPAKVFSFIVVMMVIIGGLFVFASDGSSGGQGINYAMPGSSSGASSGISGLTPSQALSLVPYSTNSSLGTFTPGVTPSFNALYYTAGVVGKYGGVYNMYVLGSGINSSASSSWYASGPGAQSYFTVVVYTYNLTQLVDSFLTDTFVNGTNLAGSSTLGSILNLVPQIVVIEGFNGTTTQSSTLAGQEANSIITQSGGSGTSLLISLNISSNVSLPGFSGSLYIYSGVMSWPGSVNNIISPITGAMNQSGPLKMFESGMNSKYLIPEGTTGSVDGAIMVAGVINPSLFGSSLLTDIGLSGSNISLIGTRIAFAGGIFYKAGVFHSSATVKQIAFSDVFNYPGYVNFTSSNIIYGLTIAYPHKVTVGSTSVNAYNFTTYASISNYSNLFNFNGTGTLLIQPVPFSLYLGTSNVTTDAIFPADLNIVTSAVNVGNGIYRVTTTVRNDDTDTLSAISISENSTLTMYSGLMNLTSGKSYITAASLSPGSSLNLTYDVSLKNFGSYAISNPNINYTSSGMQFNVTGSPSSIAVSAPNLIQAIINVQVGAFSLLGNSSPLNVLIHEYIPGIYLFEIIAILILLLDVLFEVRAYRRWKISKKNTPPPPESPPEQ